MASDCSRSCVLKAFCCAVEKAASLSDENNCREVERQLNVLVSHSEASCLPRFDMDSVSLLVKILSNPCTSPSICTSIMTALRVESAKNSAVRNVMVTQLNLLHPLSSILTKEQTGEECLKLLQQLTYGIRTTCPNGYIEDIIRFVVNGIVNKVLSTLLEGLNVLANLCQRNVTVQAYVKGLPGVHHLQRKLVSNLSDANVSVVILSLHILSNLFLTEELGAKIFSSGNMQQSFQLAFSVLFAYGTNVAGAIHAVDFLVDILSFEQMQIVLKQYGQLQECLQKMVSLLPKVEGVMKIKITELCVSLCQVPGVRAVMTKLLLQKRSTILGTNTCAFPLTTLLTDMTIPSAANPDKTLISLDLLKEITEESLDGVEMWDNMEQIKSILVQVTSICQLPNYIKEDDIIYTSLVQILKLLSILCVVASSESVAEHLWECIKDDFLLRIVQDQMQNYYAGITEKQWMSVSLEVVTLSLHLLLKHAQQSGIANTGLYSMLKEQQLVPIIGYSLQSSHKMAITVALRLLVETQNVKGFDIQRLGDAFAVINSRKKTEVIQQQPIASSEPECVNRVFMPEKVVIDTTAVDELIQKFKHGLELKDLKTSEIIDVYEHKLQVMHLKENHLQDLVDAKTLALTQADRLISQYRGRKAHIDEECLKLRTLLQDSEKCSEGLATKVDELQGCVVKQAKEIDDLKSQNVDLLHIAEEHKKLVEAFHEETAKLETAEQKLLSKEDQVRQLYAQVKMLQSSYEALTVQKQCLSEQLQEMCSDLQQLKEQYHCSEDKCQCLQNVLAEQQRKCKSLEEVKEALEGNLGSLNTKLRLSEQQLQMLTEECVAQKDEASVLKKHITRLQGELQELKTENMKLQEEVNLFSAVKSLILKKS